MLSGRMRVYSGDITGALGPHQETFLLEDYGAIVTDVACWKVCGCVVERGTFCRRCFESEDDHRNIMINPLENSLKDHTIAGNFQISRINYDMFVVPWLERNYAYVSHYMGETTTDDNGSIYYKIEWIEPMEHVWFRKVIEDYQFLSHIGYFFQVRDADVCEFQLEY